MDAKVIHGPWQPLAPETPVETPNLPAIPEPLVGEIVPARATSTTVRERPRVSRPEWLGWGPGARASLRTALWDIVKRIVGRTVFECSIRGVPRRVWRLVRWLGLGTKGWVAGLRWIFAVDERAELHRPGIPPGRAALIGEKADKSWYRRGGVFLVANLGVWFGVWHFVPPSEIPWPDLFAEYLFPLTSAKLAWIAWGLPWLVATFVHGVMHDEKELAPIVTPRQRENVDVIGMTNALRSVGVLDKPTVSNESPDPVHLVKPSRPVGIGHATTFALPASCGKFAGDVIVQRDRIAAAFASPRDQFWIEQGTHEAEFEVWQSSRNPFLGRKPEHPLLGMTEFDVWQRIPFAVDARGRLVHITLPFTSCLVGSRPRRGKSMAVRSMLVGAVLDPSVRFYVFDGKGGETWSAMAPFAEAFLEGADDDDVERVAAELEKLVIEMRERARRIKGSKLTPAMARDAAVNAPITVVIIDEAQRYLEHRKHGQRVLDALIVLAQTGPSSGFVPVVMTQRPDAKAFESNLRSMFGARLALAVMSTSDSNIIMGAGLSKDGFDASKIKIKGVGIYRPDDDVDGEPDDDPNNTREVLMFDMSDEIWSGVCEHGAEIREQTPEIAAGNLEVETGVADEQLPTATLYARFRDLAPEALPATVTDGQTLGNWLSSRGIPRLPNKVAGQRVRSRLTIEHVLDLEPGALTRCPDGVRDVDEDTSGAPPGHPHGHLSDTPTGTHPDTPH